MRPFLTIVTPHKDVLQGSPTFDIFAADLWEVFRKRAVSEYQDPDIFFQKTYITDGLKNLLDTAEKRLKGKGGDSVIQLLTPFGGGKTHSLIALYHKAKEWKSKVIVLDGSAFDPKDVILWEEIERQLTGKIEKLKGYNSPGKEKLRILLSKYCPVLILIDEILEYTTKASAIKISNSNLASQTLSFIQELTQTVSSIGNSLLVLTLPSSFLEHYGEESEKLFQQLQKITGRMEKVYEPVGEEEIASVVKRRLFSNIDEKEAKLNIEEFLDYVNREKILPEGIEKSVYRDRFLKSFPFQPEVIDVLYQRWGSFPKFQRTRGVLRLLSLVVYSLRNSKVPFIRVCDFDLSNSEIKSEFIKQIGSEYNSVISADITSTNSGAKKVDISLGDAYSPFSFGTRVATTIFIYSFSGGPEKGASIQEIKLSTAETGTPSSIVSEASSKLRENLLYLQYDRERYFFTNQPNLNSLLLRKMENVEDKDIMEEEKNLLLQNIEKKHFLPFIWPKNPKDVPDTKEFKLIVLQSIDKERCKEFLENYGKQPRVYQNTLIFLCSIDEERINFERIIREKIAWEIIEKEETNLNDQQKKEVKENIIRKREETREGLRNFYRIVLFPGKNGFNEIDLGISTYGKEILLDREVYERLRSEGELLEKIASLILKEKYLQGKDYVETKNISETFYKTPGEIRILSDDVLKDSIKEGVKQGLFGLGEIENKNPICRFFKEDCYPELYEGEILVNEKLCEKQKKVEKEEKLPTQEKELKTLPVAEGSKLELKKQYTGISLKFKVPSEELSKIANIILHLKKLFNNIEIEITLSAKEGKISTSDYEDKVKEALLQTKIEIEEEKLE
ncbi:MAG: ATP-binding protein [Candidatus Ratteibacteria bacterium]